MTDLDLTEAIEAAARSLHDEGCRCSEPQHISRGEFDLDAECAVQAAAPVVERQVRERIAAEGQAHADKQATWIIVGSPSPELAYEAGWRDAFRFVAHGGGS